MFSELHTIENEFTFKGADYEKALKVQQRKASHKDAFFVTQIMGKCFPVDHGYYWFIHNEFLKSREGE